MKKLLVAAILFAFAVFPVAAENKLQVLEIKAPKEVAPGQQVAAHITLKVLEFEGKAHLRPGGYYNFAKSKHNGNIPRTRTTPWRLKDFKVGDVLKYTARITVPENVIAGEKGMIAFRMSQPGAKKFIKLVGSNKANFTVRVPEKVDLSSPVAVKDLPVACIPFTNETVTIDGKCNDSAWKNAATLPVNLNSTSGKKADHKAEVKLITDGKYIYTAMIADAPGAQKLEVRKYPMHDSKVWNNDAMECFFVPDIYLNEYKHFITDMAGQHFDDDNGDFHGFNPVWKTASSRSENSWVIEAAIPVDAITPRKITAGTLWRGGFFRYSERAHNNSGWTATMGSHNSVSRHGYIFFGTLGDVLDKQSDFIKSVNDKSSPELIKLAKEVKALCNGSARKNIKELPETLTKLTDMRNSYEKLAFAESFAKSKLPLIIQNVFPYSGNVAPDSTLQAAAVQQSFFPGEVQDLAWNLTNVSNKTITIHAGLFGVEADKFAHHRKSRDFLLQGIPGFPAKLFAPAPAAAADGRCVYDVLAPNPAGVWRIAPKETVQIFVRVRADGSSRKGVGSLVIEGIDNGAMPVTALPVTFDLVGDNTLSQATKPFVFGWDYIPEKFAAQRPELVHNQYKMLREYGFNVIMLTGLRHFPRPQADKEGNLLEKLDFTLLNTHLRRIDKEFDYIYWDLAIWEKKVLRKDLFGLDFYSEAYGKAFKSWFKACADALQAAGVPNEKVLICPVDECSDKRAERIACWIKECRPESRVILDSSRTDMVQVKSIDRYVDVWMPHARTLQQDALQEFHEFLNKKGAMKLLYYYSAGGNEKLKNPYADYTLKFHAAFAKDFSGIGFWAGGQYYGSPWYRRGYTRMNDTALVYPVENATIPSRRLAAWHRGVQDLWLLRETALRYKDNAQIQDKLRKAAQSAVDYPNDHQRSEALRKYCRELLAAVKKKMSSQGKKAAMKKLVLLAGQSNMSGRGYLTENDVTELPGITALRWDKVWIPAIAPFNYDRINQLGLNESQDPFEEKALEINNQRRCGVGPGRTFAKLLQEKFPGSEIGLIPVSVGGTPIAAWMPGGKDKYSDRHPYDDALAMVRHAMQFGEIEVILWHQGESDAKFKTPDYKEKLITVINNFRHDLSLEHVPVILGEIGYFLNEERFAVKEYNQYIRQAAAELANTGVVSAEGLTDRGDRVHFNTPSQYELARRYFKEYCRLTDRKDASTRTVQFDCDFPGGNVR